MVVLQPPSSLQLSGNVAEYCKKFGPKFELYLTAMGAEKKNDKVKSMFLLLVGEETWDIYNNFKYEDGEHMKLRKMLTKSEEHCMSEKNEAFERHRFCT